MEKQNGKWIVQVPWSRHRGYIYRYDATSPMSRPQYIVTMETLMHTG